MLYAVLGLTALTSAFLYSQDNILSVTRYSVKSKRIPKSFDGTTVVHISDLHNKSHGKHHKRIIKAIKKISPDFIVISGDIMHCYDKWYHFNRIDYNKRIAISSDFVRQCSQYRPTYYSPGNHEAKCGVYDKLSASLRKAGATLLESEKTVIAKNGESISLYGMRDATFYTLERKGSYDKALKALVSGDENYKLLISHRPELYDIYKDCGIDVVFSGHAHGGQLRFPFTDGVFAPNQGILPKYTSGVHRFGSTNLVISRGLGNSSCPFRLFNLPEVVAVTLCSEQ